MISVYEFSPSTGWRKKFTDEKWRENAMTNQSRRTNVSTDNGCMKIKLKSHGKTWQHLLDIMAIPVVNFKRPLILFNIIFALNFIVY